MHFYLSLDTVSNNNSLFPGVGMQVTQEWPLQQGVIKRWSVTVYGGSVHPWPLESIWGYCYASFLISAPTPKFKCPTLERFNLGTTATVLKSKEGRKERGYTRSTEFFNQLPNVCTRNPICSLYLSLWFFCSLHWEDLPIPIHYFLRLML